MTEITEAKRAMNSIELAIRRVADRMRGDGTSTIVIMLDELADEISKLRERAEV